MHSKASCESNVTVRMNMGKRKMFTEISVVRIHHQPSGRLDKRLSQKSVKLSKQIQQISLNSSQIFTTERVCQR